MPLYFKIVYPKCGFKRSSRGWDGQMYVYLDNGQRVVLPHPGESYFVMRATGKSIKELDSEGRIDMMMAYFCESYFRVHRLELRKDELAREKMYESIRIVSDRVQSDQGYVCRSESSGLETLRFIRKNPEVDLAILDMKMTEPDDIPRLDKTRSTKLSIPVVMYFGDSFHHNGFPIG